MASLQFGGANGLFRLAIDGNGARGRARVGGGGLGRRLRTRRGSGRTAEPRADARHCGRGRYTGANAGSRQLRRVINRVSGKVEGFQWHEVEEEGRMAIRPSGLEKSKREAAIRNLRWSGGRQSSVNQVSWRRRFPLACLEPGVCAFCCRPPLRAWLVPRS